MKNRQAWPILNGPWWSLQNLQFSRTRRKRSAKVEEQFEFRVEKNALFDEPMNQLLHWTAIHWGRVHQLTMTRKSIWGMSGLSAVPSLINTPSRKTGCVLDLFISGSLISMLFDVIWCYLMLMLGDGVLPKQQPMSGEVLEDYGWVPVRLWLVGVPRL